MSYEQILKKVFMQRKCIMYGDGTQWPPCIAAPHADQCQCVIDARQLMLEQSLQK